MTKLTTAEEMRKRLFKLIYTDEERPEDDDNASLIAEIEIREFQSQTLEAAVGMCDEIKLAQKSTADKFGDKQLKHEQFGHLGQSLGALNCAAAIRALKEE